MQVLVAGGAGFVGSHLCARLLRDDHYVYCVDDLSTGRLENIGPYQKSQRFAFVPRSVIDPLWVPVDAIFNLASPATPLHYQLDPEHTLRTNVEGNRRLLKLAQETGSHLIYASTSEVYGNPAEHPQGENYLGNVRMMGPRACYDEGKRCAETLSYLYAQRGTSVSVVRIFNTYGPRMRVDDGRTVSNLLTQALRGEPLTLYGDGSQTRSFCYVDDLVEALMRVLYRGRALPGPLNLGNPKEITLLDLAREILEVTGADSRIEFAPLPVDDPLRRCPDIGFAQQLLDWTPQTSLQAGLARTMHHFRRVLDGAAATSGRPAVGAA